MTYPFCSRRSKQSASGFTLAAMLLFFTGCGEDHPTTIPVEGTVTYQGQPLNGGELTFQPTSTAAANLQRPAIGVIQQDGTYRLSTFSQGDGALPGEYLVTVSSLVGPAPMEVVDGVNGTRESRIPLHYANPATSGLRASVPADSPGTLTIDFDLP